MLFLHPPRPSWQNLPPPPALTISASSTAPPNPQPPPPSSVGRIKRLVLTNEGRAKLNVLPDREFYSYPRFVTHVDDSFISSLTSLYRERLSPGWEVLDLMSSWVSHLPGEVEYKRVVGHGLNAQELAKNPRLDYFFVKDLNTDQELQAESCSFDSVLCTVSVQYLQWPEKDQNLDRKEIDSCSMAAGRSVGRRPFGRPPRAARCPPWRKIKKREGRRRIRSIDPAARCQVFAEVLRVLKPGGVFIVSFSNKMFYDKAISSWRDGTGYSRVQLVMQYFQCVEGFTEAEVVKKFPSKVDESPLGTILRLVGISSSDPFYAVIAYRNFKPITEVVV